MSGCEPKSVRHKMGAMLRLVVVQASYGARSHRRPHRLYADRGGYPYPEGRHSFSLLRMQDFGHREAE